MDETADKIEALGNWNINKSSQTRFEYVQFSQIISPSIQIYAGVVLWSFFVYKSTVFPITSINYIILIYLYSQ